MREFGNINLKIIKNKYPELDQIFKLNIIESKALHHSLIRLFLKKPIAQALLKSVKIFPLKIRLWCIQFLVFYSIYKGYKSNS
jgi:hypothetical protein